jgi:phosphoglucosamine mutase
MMGGESSGHLIFLDKHTTGDGIVAALQVLATVRRSQISLSERLADIHLFPQVLINIRYKKEYEWKSDPAFIDIQEKVQKELAEDGRILIRASGTEPVLRVMVEAKSQELAQRCAQQIADRVPV